MIAQVLENFFNHGEKLTAIIMNNSRRNELTGVTKCEDRNSEQLVARCSE